MALPLTEPTPSLQGVTAVIVEDNMLVADSMRLTLESLDCEVAGMAGTVERASALVADGNYDIAILDIDLRGSSVLPVVAVVRERRKPFFFVSGYGDETVLPAELRNIRRLNKPVDPDVLARTIRAVIEDS